MNKKSPMQMILEDLRKEQSCFAKLIAALKKQKKAIEDEDETRLLKTVEDKNILIETFQKLDGEIETQLLSLSPEETSRLAREGEAIRVDIEHALETILLLEEECEKEIASRMQNIEEKIRGVKKGQTLTRGYGSMPRIKPIISRKA
ncbi:hypothetical protein UZ36_02400 [Candidatus Nitromaritima sp. SCGC AAA799-C22]|nr:hypothetical protein UZ36_02400 [Candidatus Nitromaritima sp. SCGC AAA799-C22]